jgi:hypothetical protein
MNAEYPAFLVQGIVVEWMGRKRQDKRPHCGWEP